MCDEPITLAWEGTEMARQGSPWTVHSSEKQQDKSNGERMVKQSRTKRVLKATQTEGRTDEILTLSSN